MRTQQGTIQATSFVEVMVGDCTASIFYHIKHICIKKVVIEWACQHMAHSIRSYQLQCIMLHRLWNGLCLKNKLNTSAPSPTLGMFSTPMHCPQRTFASVMRRAASCNPSCTLWKPQIVIAKMIKSPFLFVCQPSSAEALSKDSHRDPHPQKHLWSLRGLLCWAADL